MRTKIRAVSLLLVTAAVFLWAQTTGAVGVRPLVVDISARPGDTQEFELTLTPSGAPETVALSLYQPVQLITGSLSFQEPDLDAFPVVKWVTLEETRVTLYPGPERTVKGRIQVPFDAGGSHTVIVMVESEPPEGQTGIVFKIRYAVRVNIRVDRPGLRQTAKLEDFGLVSGENNEALVKATLANTSAWDYRVSGEVTIRDSERRLVARLPLRSIANVNSNSDSLRMYPGSRVEYFAEVTKRLSPGDYTLRLFMRYGDHGQIIQSQTVTIAEGDFNFPSIAEVGAFSVEPAELELQLRPGQQKTEVLQLMSEVSDTVYVFMSGSEVEPQYMYSPLEWIQLRTPSQFELSGRGRSRVIMTIAAPRDAESASYHGDIVLSALSEDGQLVSQRTVPICVTVGDVQTPDAEVRSLAAVPSDGELSLSLDLYNCGNVFLTPHASIMLTDAEGLFAGRAMLTLPEGVDKVIPLKSQELTGTIEDLAPGVYTAGIVIESNGTEVLSTELPLEIGGVGNRSDVPALE